MAVYDTKLATIVEALGRYYGVVSKEKFMAILAFDGNVQDFGSVNLDPTSEMFKVIRSFTDATEGGAVMYKSYESLVNILTGASAREVRDMKEMAQRIYRFIGEPESLRTFDSGTINHRFICSRVSVKDMCKITEVGDGAINGAFASPTKYTPNLCALEVLNPKLVPATRDTGAAGLFMNCMPTIELSVNATYHRTVSS